MGQGFLDAIGSPHYYTSGSQDVNNRFAASALLYGNPLVVPIPDLKRTRLLLMLGANPLVSHGSVLSAPRVRDQLNDIVRAGGRVVVVDPRRTETARAFEHVSIDPDGDAWLLLSLLQVIFAEERADEAALTEHTGGVTALRALVAEHSPEATAGRTGIDPDTVRALARDLAAARGGGAGGERRTGRAGGTNGASRLGRIGGVVYGRTGSCLGRHGTLVAFLIDALNAVTGNLDRPGGAVFGRPAIALDEVGERFGLATYGKVRSRIGNFPDVIGNLPAALLPREITTPGDRQIRALFVSAGNPVLSVPDGDALESALGELDLCVSLDLYVNETNRHADYVLPAATWLERADVPVAFLGFFTTPFVQSTEAVVPPAGEAREEWEVIESIARRVGVVPASVPAVRALGRLGIRFDPRRTLDLMLRTGAHGDWFGLRRGGLSLAALRRHPHGKVINEHIPTGVLARKVRHAGGRVQLAPAEIEGEVALLRAESDAVDAGAAAALPLRLIGMRELRSHNSWMHNAPLLMRGGRTHALRIHPDDAEAHGVVDAGQARLSSRHGAVEVDVLVTDEMRPGTVALPHGWGHRGGWRLANAHAGVNVNLLTSSDPEDLERLAGMARLNGIPVRVEPAAPAGRSLAR